MCAAPAEPTPNPTAPGFPRLRRCGSRTRRVPLLIVALVASILPASFSPRASAQDPGSRGWLPVPAESLQGWADAIERARAERDPRRERNALEGLAAALLEGVPDGGFPLGAGRWIGPGTYLATATAGLPDVERVRLIEAIDLLVRARLERSADTDDLERWLRDLPLSDDLDPERAAVAATLLEGGLVESWLAFTDEHGGDPRSIERAAIERLAAPLPRGEDPPPLARPYRPVLTARWPTTGDERSPWSAGALRVEPVIAGSLLYFTTPDGVHCWDHVRGRELWFFPFVADAPPIVPGVVRRPILCGPTLIVTTERGIIGLDRARGSVRFEHRGNDLFPARGGRPDEAASRTGRTTVEAPTDPENAGSPILTISPPALTERGAVITVSRVEAGTLDLRIVLLSPTGTILWNRDAGSAIGASYLALGSVLLPPVAHGDSIIVPTGRGALLRHSTLDGSLVWAAPYPSYAPTATRDALRNLPRPRDARLESAGDRLFLTSHDSGGLRIIDRRDGRVHAELPLGPHRWWAISGRTSDALSGADRTLLLAAPDRWTTWSVPANDAGSPRCDAEFELPPGLPPFSGPPVAVADGWWVPHAEGAYRLFGNGSIASVIDAHPHATMRSILPVGSGVLIQGDGFMELRHPTPPDEGSLSRWWDEIARGAWSALPDPLPPRDPRATSEVRADEERAARTILWQLRRPGIASDLRLRVVPDAVARIGDLDDRRRIAVREARTALRREEGTLAVELCWLALAEGEVDLPIEVEPAGAIPLEIVVRRILADLRDAEQRLPGQEALEERAAMRLRSLQGDRIATRIEVFERCPGTAVGRRAALEAAEDLYHFGNIGASLDLLESLVLFEPLNGEAVEARLRIVELAGERGDVDRARRRLEELVADYGDLTLEVADPAGVRTVTIRERCERLEESLPDPDAAPANAVSLPLLPAWRARTDLDHIRNLRVAPLLDGKRYLTISRRSLGVRVAETGERVWHRTLPPIPAEEQLRSWSETGRFAEPIAIEDETVWMTDRREVFAFDLGTGAILRRLELPRLPPDDQGVTIQSIDRTLLAEGVLLVLGESAGLYAFDPETGAELWRRALPGPLEGPLSVRNGRVLLGVQSPSRVEVWSLIDGAPLWAEDLESLGTALAHEPWFAPLDREDPGSIDDIVIPCDDGLIRRVDLAAGTVQWSVRTPASIRRLHRGEDPRFWIAELLWSRSTPSLIGFDPRNGSFLWQKSFEARRRGLHALVIDDGDLYFVEGDYNQRIASCLEVPRVFHRELREGEDTPRELRTRWTTPLIQSWDTPDLSVHQNWLLVVDRLSCELTVLSREVGVPIPPRNGFLDVQEFLRGRQRLDYAGFIDGTLVLETARGALGLRAPDLIAVREALWVRLAELPPGGGDPVSDAPVADARRAFREGNPERALRLLEDAVEEPSLDLDHRRALFDRLQALGEVAGEDQSPQWRIPRIEVPPTIDGSLEEAWNAATAWTVERARYFRPIQGTIEDAASWRGKRDLSVMLLAAWSDEGFHLALDVADDSVQAYDNDLEHWNGDCLLLAFDFLGDGGTRSRRDDQLFTLALTVPKRQAPGGAGAGAGGDGEGEGGEGDPPEDPEDEEEDGPAGEFQVIRKGDGSGVIYEATIPWKTFREARGQLSLPHPGMMFRMNLVLTDDDSGRAATSYMSLSTGQLLREERRSVWDVFIPERFPRILLGR